MTSEKHRTLDKHLDKNATVYATAYIILLYTLEYSSDKLFNLRLLIEQAYSWLYTPFHIITRSLHSFVLCTQHLGRGVCPTRSSGHLSCDTCQGAAVGQDQPINQLKCVRIEPSSRWVHLALLRVCQHIWISGRARIKLGTGLEKGCLPQLVLKNMTQVDRAPSAAWPKDKGSKGTDYNKLSSLLTW